MQEVDSSSVPRVIPCFAGFGYPYKLCLGLVGLQGTLCRSCVPFANQVRYQGFFSKSDRFNARGVNRSCFA